MQYINIYTAIASAAHLDSRGWAVVLQFEDRALVLHGWGETPATDIAEAMVLDICASLKDRCHISVFGDALEFNGTGHAWEIGSWDGGGRPRHAYLELAAEEAEHALLS